LPIFWRFCDLGQCRNVCGTDFELEGVEKLAKMMQNGRHGTGLNLAFVLHLVQSLIYPGATFSPVPAKRYECPSIKINLAEDFDFFTNTLNYLIKLVIVF